MISHKLMSCIVDNHTREEYDSVRNFFSVFFKKTHLNWWNEMKIEKLYGFH